MDDHQRHGMHHLGRPEPVAKHAYFGNRDLILRDLEGMDGWNRGHVTLQPGSCVRGRTASSAACGSMIIIRISI